MGLCELSGYNVAVRVLLSYPPWLLVVLVPIYFNFNFYFELSSSLFQFLLFFDIFDDRYMALLLYCKMAQVHVRPCLLLVACSNKGISLSGVMGL